MRLSHPALTAMTASTLQELSGDRFVLGLGTANPRLNEAVPGLPPGLPPAQPLARMRDYVDVLRRAVPAAEIDASVDAGVVRGLRLDRPARVTPVLPGALLPRLLELAGEVADGVILNLTPVAQVPLALDHVGRGLARSGRERSGFTVACVLQCCLSPDPSTVQQVGREVVGGYAQHPSAAALFAASGFADAHTAVAERLAAGDRAGPSTGCPRT